MKFIGKLFQIRHNRFFLVVLLCTLLSLPFLINKFVDSDFFAFYYVGRGINEGKRMYSDFSDNKGPITYIFFLLLDKVFGNNYIAAIISSLVFFSSLITLLTLNWLTEKKPEKNILPFLFANILMFDFLGFFTNMNSGIYSQTLGIVFIFLALIAAAKSRYFFSGLTLILAVLSRQTLIFYVIPIFYLVCQQPKKLKALKMFILGGILALTITFAVVYILNSGFNSVLYNMVLHNLGYSVSNSFLENLLNVLFHALSDARLGILFFLILFAFLHYLSKSLKGKKAAFGLFLSIGGICSTFLGGMFHPHLMMQTLPILSYLLYDLFHHTSKKYVFGALTLFLFAGYLNILNVHVSKGTSLRDPAELIVEVITPYLPEYEYLQILGYHPKVYFLTNNRAPGRFFSPFFLSTVFNEKNKEQLLIHKKEMSPDILEKTLFIAPKFSLWDTHFYSEYMKDFEEVFQLTSLEGGTDQIQLYKSLANPR